MVRRGVSRNIHRRFRNFGSNTFLRSQKVTSTSLRSIMSERGIYIRTTRSIRIADAFADLETNGFTARPPSEPTERPAISLMTLTDAEAYKKNVRHEVLQSAYSTPPATPGQLTAGLSSASQPQSTLSPRDEKGSTTRVQARPRTSETKPYDQCIWE